MDITRREFAVALGRGGCRDPGAGTRPPSTIDPSICLRPFKRSRRRPPASRRSRTRSAAPESPGRSDSWRHGIGAVVIEPGSTMRYLPG